MKNKTKCTISDSREATEDERMSFENKMEWLITMGYFSDEDDEEEGVAWEDTVQEHRLAVIDNCFRPESEFDGRLLVADFAHEDGSHQQLHFAWKRHKTGYFLGVLSSEDVARETLLFDHQVIG